jgi:8-oxo-dGTP diphosphatase
VEFSTARFLGGTAMTDVVAALIWDNGRFMICQRPAYKARGLLWEFVGGKTDPGETMEEALIRECKEELGITVSVGDVYMQVIHDYPDILIRLTLFHCTIAEGTPKLLEHNDLKWILPSQIPEFDFCPADEDILARIISDYK